jgi:hypothetical protein
MSITNLRHGLLSLMVVGFLALAGCGGASTARLQALQARVLLAPAGGQTSEVAVNQVKTVRAGDRVGIEGLGRALLRFADALQVELLRQGDLTVRAVPTSNDPVASLFLAAGTTLADLQGEAQQRVAVETETPFAVIRATGTTYLVAYDADSISWVVSFQGEVEVRGRSGDWVKVPAGWTTWVMPNRPAQPPVRVDLNRMNDWLKQMRGTGDALPVGQAVINAARRSP